MVLGYLILGIFGAVASSIFAVLAGYSLLAAAGFYILGGVLTSVVIVCAGLCYQTLSQPSFPALKA